MEGVISNQPGGSDAYGGNDNNQFSDVVLEQPKGQPPGGYGFSNQVDPRVAHMGFLAQLPMLLIQQKKNMTECLTCCEMANKYFIKNQEGQILMEVRETSNFLARICIGKQRPWSMHILNGQGQEMMRLERPCYCCEQQVTIMVGDSIVGTVQQDWACCHGNFRVLNDTNDVVYTINGFHYCSCYCCEDIPINISDKDGNPTNGGRIVKKWRGCGSEILEKDNFEFTLPTDADVMQRVLLIGALFAVDFLYFEVDRE